MEDSHHPVELQREEFARYSRHLTLPEVGPEGQRKLKRSSVLVIGAGGLGAPVSLYLAAAGVGRIGLVDFDRVEVSNLQRQVLFGDQDVGRPKVEAARERLAAINPFVKLELHDTRLTPSNAMSLLEPYDLVVDGTDNFPTRYLVNDACVLAGKTNMYGSIYRFEGQASVFADTNGPCYRCLFPEPPAPGAVPNCAEGGVLGVLPGIIGSIQATEAIKRLLGAGTSLVGRLLLFDALEMRFRELALRKDPDCPVCGKRPLITSLDDPQAMESYQEVCAVTVEPDRGPTAGILDVTTLKQKLDRGEKPFILDVRTRMEWEICHLDGSTLLPLNELPGRAAEMVPREREIVVICHSGIRSAAAVEWLAGAGYRSVSNLTGGIDAWAAVIDSEMPRY
ncbi:MAG: molybdopterin-synthase adenylyltransferase MoeB [Acidobacteria bacterium]|uniref:Molybdopterin-synthase adenylyltransferase n=1 Tax=Candidatus Polarisedimenticola svalbardensis TaxID=2886004 RepID=A0A8J7C2E6_9BACT|nr:molybdopterin-synthase adenylyltransferase MoeB [Candidatus Polarisedimenticola svalbardensis]